ncbi:uncharacterized protein FOMMEDRAFT_121185 [Fomitiporia mediterranea MF3/22]|uniref:uncharacterized protein n=1 Tax=Fomitiporia mediterranea (strain MF3/22) TaxID=694068 RepID=UPI0004409BF9|nr:uncharacterized protein FOMMEDRAFT_121185 [Fomitiporia mediterranea MF3/22]EJD03875.1 hypothetical protein FOMMEDRAFT_121185 [Fomitiporia mediterranea MF3/22]
MFSGFRNVMENLAQPQPRPSHPGRSESQELATDSERLNHQHARGSASFDLSSVAHSTGTLAESAFSNLRKSLAAQRPYTATSPSAESPRAGSSSPKPDRELRPVSKPGLEERLRASFAIGDVSTSPTPTPSHAPSPGPHRPAPTNEVVSPRSVPLPDSVPTSPVPIDIPAPIPLSLQIMDVPLESHPLAEDVVEPSVGNGGDSTAKSRDFKITISPTPRYPEADIPLPLASPVPTNLSASQSSQSSHLSASPVLESPAKPSGTEEDTEGLETRLKLLEAQFNDVSTSLKRLTASQDAVNAVLAELTPVRNVEDVEELRKCLQDLNQQRNLSQEEIKRLNGKLSTYDERIDELRDTHRLESRSQTELVDNLRKQLEESEALLKAAQVSTMQAEEDARARQVEIEQARAEAQKLRNTAKDEEEKRVKAVSLLKTVRQKLTKAEKERDDAVKEVESLKEKERAALERERLEKARFENEIEVVRGEKERDIAGLKSHFDKELAGMRDKLEKEFTARKGQIELEVASIKAAFQKEVSAKNAKIQTLENSVRSLNSERDSLFDQLQMRQAEVESSQSALESLQSSTSELQFQLRELTERNSLLAEELADAQRELEYRLQKPAAPANDDVRLRAVSEAKYEARINELTARLTEVERDRNDTEVALSRSLQQKTQEIEALKKSIDTSSQTKGVTEEEMMKLRREIEALQHETSVYKEQLVELDRQKDRVNELEARLQKQNSDFEERSEQYERDVAEAKERERQVRASNKTLREELRKVQTSAAFLERQRNPGIGYWGNVARHENSSEAILSSPTPSTPELASTSRVGSPSPATSDQEVNLEYLRNVILQFLEHKDMRPHLVRVLSIILHFTPQETRRLIAKV